MILRKQEISVLSCRPTTIFPRPKSSIHFTFNKSWNSNKQCVFTKRNLHKFFNGLAWKLNLTYNYCGGHLINSVSAFLLNHRGREKNNGEINLGMHRILNVSRQQHLFPPSLSDYEHLSSGAFAPSALFLEMTSVRDSAQYHHHHLNE